MVMASNGDSEHELTGGRRGKVASRCAGNLRRGPDAIIVVTVSVFQSSIDSPPVLGDSGHEQLACYYHPGGLLGAAFVFLTTCEAAWYIILLVSVCLSVCISVRR